MIDGGDLHGSTRFTVDVSVLQLNPDIVLGGSPPRLIRFREGTAMGTHLAPTASLAASDLTPRTLRRLVDAGVIHPDPVTLRAVSNHSLTVVIPTRNRADLLARALGALGGRFRVIVVDDASDNPRELDEVAGVHQAEIIHLAVNVGPGGARNAGLAKVNTDFVAFIDSDVVADPEALSMLLRHFANPGLAAVAPRVLAFPSASTSGFVERFEALEPPLDMGAFPALVRAGTRVSYLPTACLIARMAAVRTGFDESLRTGEDVDLVWRLDQQGWLVRYEPAVAVHHSSRPRAAAWARQHYGYGLSASRLRIRHGDAVAPARLTQWSAIMALGVWIAAWKSRGPSYRVSIAALGVALGATVVGYAQTRSALGRVAPEVRGHAGHLTATTARLSLEQSLSLLLRHWAPISLVGGLLWPQARYLLAAGAMIDAWRAHPKSLPEFAIKLVGNRVVAFTYGLGVWVGMLRERDFRAALPVVKGGWGKTRLSANRASNEGDTVDIPGRHAGIPNWFKMDAKAHFEEQLANREFPKYSRALQLGAYTGDASVWLMENTEFTLTDVDTWEGSHEAAHAELDWIEIEAIYDRKTAQYRSDGPTEGDCRSRIRKVKLPSSTFLREERSIYNFVYIDAAHDAVSVLSDAMLALPLLASGSLLVFDDYAWNFGQTPLENPKDGIDKFLEIYSDRFTILKLDTQVWLRLN